MLRHFRDSIPVTRKLTLAFGLLFLFGLVQSCLLYLVAAHVVEPLVGVGTGACLTVLAGLTGIGLRGLIVRPLGMMIERMEALAAGDIDKPIAFSDRGDCMGRMARALQKFRDAAVAKLKKDAWEAESVAAWKKEDEERTAREAEEAHQDQVAIQGIAHGLGRLADGDLLYRIATPFAPKTEKLRADFNAAVERLQQTMSGVCSNTQRMRLGIGEIAAASDDLSRRTEQQAANLEETAATLDEITATVKHTAQGATRAQEVVSSAKSDADRSGDVVRQAIAAMGGIETSSRQISQIIGVIDEIAFQTNLLALNAGVEAARAGDAGRGFAVVASEVRALAQRSAEAAKEIKSLISTSTSQVELGVDLVGETGKALARIVEKVAELNAVVCDIAASAKEESTALQQVNVALNQMDQVTQQNAAMVEQTTAAAHSLNNESEELVRLMASFKVGPTPVEEPVRTKARPQAQRPARPALRAVSTRTRGGAVRKPEPSSAEAADAWEEF